MLKIILDNQVRFKYTVLESINKKCFEELIKRFTYDNPKYLENEKWGYSNAKVDRYIFSYKLDSNSGVVSFSRGCFNYLIRFFQSRNIPYSVIDKRLLLPEVDYSFSNTVLREDQKEFVKALLKAKSGLGIGNTSFGKTISSLELIRYSKQPALVLVHTEFLQKQWIKEATNPALFNIPKNLIGGCGGVFRGKERVGLLNICLYQSLSMGKFLNMFKDKVGILIADEHQKVGIDLMSETIRSFPAYYRFGVSASKTRKDGKFFVVEDTIGEIVHEVVEKSSSSKILSDIYLIGTDYRDYEYTEDNNYSAFITRASQDKERNTLILRRVLKKLEMNKQVMILLERKEQACVLYSALEKKGIKCGLLIGPVNKKDISLFKNNSAKKVALEYDDKKAYEYVKKYAEMKKLQVIIGTQKAEVGLSVRTLNHLIITTPVGSNISDRLNQMVGRVERTHGDLEEKFGVKPKPTVDILIDTKVGKFYKHVNLIKEFYGSRCYVVR